MTVSITTSLTQTSGFTPITGDVSGVALAGLAGGGIFVGADTGTQTSVQYLNGALVQTGQVNGIIGSAPAAAQLTNGNVVVATQDTDSIVFRIQSTNGGSVANAVDIGDLGGTNADVTALQNGGFVIANQDAFSVTDTEIDLRFFNSAGVQTASLDIASTENDRNPSVTTLDNGNVVVVWERTTGGSSEIMMSIYTQDGVTIFASSLVDSAGTINVNPQVVATSQGFAIFYEDNGWGTGGTDITMARYQSNGNLIGFSNVSNPNGTLADANDTHVQVTRLPDGFLAFSYERTDGDQDVFTRIVADDGSYLSDGAFIRGVSSVFANQTGPDLALIGQSSIATVVATSDLGVEGEVNEVRITHTSDFGFDTMFSGVLSDSFIGSGIDVVSYANSTAGVTVNLGAGTASGGYANGDDLSNISSLIGSDFADTLTGSALNDLLVGKIGNDVLYGGGDGDNLVGDAGNDTLNGGTGADYLSGGTGNDVYFVDQLTDSIQEIVGQGTADLVGASATYALDVGVEVEYLITTNAALTTGINLTGNALTQRITGNAGNNILSSGAVGAADTMTGLAGSDIYRVFNAGDTIVEGVGQGIADRVTAWVSFALSADDNIEYLSAASPMATTTINLTGNALAQSITGNAGANRIDGKGGSDTLAGGPGADVFVFSTALGAGNIDKIVIYDTPKDRIEIDNAVFTGMIDTNSALAAAAYAQNTTGLATLGAQRIICETDTGFLWFDQDGSGGAFAARHFATVAIGTVLTAGEFMVI